MIHLNKKIITAFTLIFCVMMVVAQNGAVKLSGIVVDPYNVPIEGAVVTLSCLKSSVKTDKQGKFEVEVPTTQALISVWYPGYYSNVQPVADRKEVIIKMISDSKPGYSDNMLLPFRGMTNIREKQTNLFAIQRNDIALNNNDVEQAFAKIPGMQVIGKSGMPGEGSFFNIRGVNTITANSTPLIVINGVPYMPDMNESGIIGGFSKGALNVVNPRDIQNITVLKGANAAVYGSLGSNGVIMIETDKAVDLDTKVQLFTQFGMDFNQSKLPVMGVSDYKGYISNVALTKYDDMAQVLTKFPFLVDDQDYYYKYLYNNNTDWQNEIYSPGFTTENVLKIKGGDAISKHDISIGYKNKNGALSGTNYSKYYVRVNSDVNLSRKVSMFAAISMSYLDYKVQEQGMLEATNPMLAALKKGPLFASHQKDANNNILPDFASIRDQDGNLIENNSVTNPSAIVSLMNGLEHGYDFQVNGGANYKANDYLTITGTMGLSYYSSRQKMFIPGITNPYFMPHVYGVAQNTVRDAEGNTYNRYFNINASYLRTFNGIHQVRATVGSQLMMNSAEYDAGTGYNTANDFYKTLNNVVSTSRRYYGYNEVWNWLNFNANAEYLYNHQFALGLTLAADASSASGPDAPLFSLYPAVNATWMTKNAVLKNVSWLDKLNVRAEWVNTGNSRYSSSLSKYYYINKVFRELSGVVRAGIPNTTLTPELNTTFNAGFDASLLGNRVDLTFDIYTTRNKNLIMPVAISAAYGTNYLYDNVGESKNTGLEAGLQIALIHNRDFKWFVNGTFSLSKNEVVSLGGRDNMLLSMSDGSALITEKGKPVYSFYGYETQGIFATAEEAAQSGLKTVAGTAFEAGDVHFVDQDKNGVIDDRDRVNLGSADPDFFGTFGTRVQYKNFELSAGFAYSVGNKMYNAVRRSMESMSDFTNQLVSVNRRWMNEGQVTDMPRAMYGDPLGNNRFSDRWIEDASYLKLKEVTLSYNFNFMSGSTVFVTGENLFTVTNYLGLDPETMYSYDSSLRGFDYAKVAMPLSFKVGLKVQF